MKQNQKKKTTSLTSDVQDTLNKQLGMESYASFTYLAMASWCDRNGYDNSANFFYTQAEEERGHMLRIFHYINNVGGVALAPEVTEIKHDYDSLRDVFQTALAHEINVTGAINNIIEVCRKEKDFLTENFLQWFITEQVEEEFVARRCVELFDFIGEEGHGLFLIDQEIPKITFNADA